MGGDGYEGSNDNIGDIRHAPSLGGNSHMASPCGKHDNRSRGNDVDNTGIMLRHGSGRQEEYFSFIINS